MTMTGPGLLALALVGIGRTGGAALEPPPAEAVTYHRHIEPVIRERCTDCHRTGAAGPFPLVTYADVAKRARQIAVVTGSRFMPPWLPEPGHGAFVGARRLTDAQIELIRRWAAAGAPEGDGRDEPPPMAGDGWTIGPPEIVLAMDEPYVVPAEGSDVMHTFVLPVPLDEERFVTAVDLRMTSASVVHRALLLVDATGAARATAALFSEPGFPMAADVAFNFAGSFGSWSRGQIATPLPAGYELRLLPESDLCLELHFEPSGKPEAVRCEVGLHLADRPPAHEVGSIMMGSICIDIDAGERSYVVVDDYVTPFDLDLVALTPRAGFLCREMLVTAEFPDGAVAPLLLIRRWDPNWQQRFQYVDPVCLPAGTRLELRYVYDNTADNPQNPSHPPRRVMLGHGAFGEMALLQLHVAPTDPADAPLVEQANEEEARDRNRRYRAWRNGQRGR